MHKKLPFPRFTGAVIGIFKDIIQGFRTHPVRWSVFLVVLLICLASLHIRGLRHSFFRGYSVAMKMEALMAITMGMHHLEMVYNDKSEELGESLENRIDFSVGTVLCCGGPPADPWYIDPGLGENKGSHERITKDVLMRVAAYRVDYPGKYLSSDDRYWDELMSYLSADSTVDLHLPR